MSGKGQRASGRKIYLPAWLFCTFIPKFEPHSGDFDDLLLIGFGKTHLEDRNHLDRMVHFFLYDYRFEQVWKNPDSDIERLSCY